MSIFADLLGIFVLGFIGGTVPGPILTSCFTEALRKGFVGSFRVMFLASVSEIMVATTIMILLFSLHVPNGFFYAISLIGSIVLIWMAQQVWQIKKLNSKGEIFSFKKIFLLTIGNGPLWIFWSTICVPQAFLLSKKIAGGQILFLIAFELGWFASTILLTFIFSRFRPLLVKEKIVSKVFKLLALILGFFAIKLFITGVSFLIGK